MRTHTVGIYNLHMPAKGGGEKRTLALAEHWSRSHRVLLFVSEPVDQPELEGYFGVDLAAVEIVVLKGSEADHARRIRTADLDVFVNNSWASNLECPAPRGLFMCMFPHRYGSGPRKTPCRPPSIDSYDVITANSRFTATWVQRWWERAAIVVYSACDPIPSQPGLEKERIILNVGRFCGESLGNHKRQDVLLETFIRLPRLHDAGWELHLVGSPAVEDAGRAFLASLESRASGYRVQFHVGANRAELVDLYRRATVYWHATGYGYSADREPARQEHFGITTVEAMSAGVVPVVIGSGGHRETVTHGVDGFLWSKPRQLASRTLRLASDPLVCRRMSHEAAVSARRFTRAAFTERMDRVLDELLRTPTAQRA